MKTEALPVILKLENGSRNAVPLQNKGSVAAMPVSPNIDYLAYSNLLSSTVHKIGGILFT